MKSFLNKDSVRVGLVAASFLVVGLFGGQAFGDEFTEEDVKHWMDEYQVAAKEGRELWTSGALGPHGVACAPGQPNGANTPRQTYPKYQKQLGKVVAIREMINWCIQNPLQGEPLPLDSKKMTAIEAYLAWERRGVKLTPGKH